MKLKTKMDKEGRIVLPMLIRKEVKILPHDELNICIESGKIVVEKEEYSCSACGTQENLKSFKGIIICDECMNELSKAQ